MNQNNMPVYEALNRLKRERIVPFDVPGHKRGKANPELTEFLGEKCMNVDVNSMKMLDNLCHPVSVIKEAQELAAEAFKAKNAFFMVGGTTSCVQAMIMSVCKEGKKIIMPRNVHRSAINALVLNGGVPIYVNPGLDNNIGISLGMKYEDVKIAIESNPDAVAVFINNPTYYGICSDVRKITELAHKYNMKVLVDEAHGTHFYFNDKLPVSAMEAGADMAAVSMHKSGGSLTQSSILLMGENINEDYVRQIINLTQTTSGSYLLLSSLDMSRKILATEGEKIFERVIELAAYARKEINEIGDYYAYGEELVNGRDICDFDITKLSVNTINTGLAGIEVYELLRDEYDIQIEFGDMANILAYISVGDRERDIERLVGALSEIRRKYKRKGEDLHKTEYIPPYVCISPKEAFFAEKKAVKLREAKGCICGEFVMCYPPGIPVLAPGEKVTAEIIDYIEYAKQKGSNVLGTEDINVEYINVIR